MSARIIINVQFVISYLLFHLYTLYLFEGNQPEGKMTVSSDKVDIPGYPNSGAIKILYVFNDGTYIKDGVQAHYYGTSRVAYLPNNKEGNEILELLKKCFNSKLTFTIGTSVTTGN